MINLFYRFTRLQRVLFGLGLTILLYCAFFQLPSSLRFNNHVEPVDEKPKEKVYIDDGSKVLALSSRKHDKPKYSLVNGVGLDSNIFNPALIELPKGSKHEFMVITRVGHVYTWQEGKQYAMAKQVAFFADMHKEKDGEVMLKRTSSARTILDGEDAIPFDHHCTSADGVRWNVDKNIGPEDTRLYWTNSGVPLLQFTSQVKSDTHCQGIFIIDARAAVPELVEAFGDYADKLPPIKIDKPRHLQRPPQPLKTPEPDPNAKEGDPPPMPDNPHEREKNWAPFEAPPFAASGNGSLDELMFHIQPYEQRIYRYKASAEHLVPVHDPHPKETEECFDDKMHQATPLLSLTLCKRGECEPNIHNTVLIGVIQKLRATPFYKWYQAHVVTWNATEPYNYRSVSRRISYLGMEEGKYAWSCGLVYYWKKEGIPENRSHGFVDDEVLLSFGIQDNGAAWVNVYAADLMKNHTMCKH